MSKTITYQLHIKNEAPIKFVIDFENKELATNKPLPDWTRLNNNQCEHCPLSTDDHEYCPLATRIVPFVEELSHLSSIDEIEIVVTHFETQKRMTGSAQDVLGSLLGLYIATSSCPYTEFLRPMAHFHLPLSDPDETLFRVLSMYRLGQYLSKEQTGKAYSGFDQLQGYYNDMTQVNHNLSKRIRQALKMLDTKQDATINALVLLDALSQYVPASIDDALEELTPIFKHYFKT